MRTEAGAREDPAGSAPVGHQRPRRRRFWVGLAIVGVLAVIVVAIVLAVRVSSGKHASGASPGSSGSGTASGRVASWFAAASGSACRPASRGDRLPAVVGAITCRPRGVVAVFSQVPSADDAQRYLNAQAKLHAGAVRTAWTSGSAPALGQVLFFAAKGGSTLIWTYANAPYLGRASSASREALEAWWTASGRAVVSGAAP